MANNINIVITADDKASKPLQYISDEMEGASSKSSKFKSALGSLGGVLAATTLAAGALAIGVGTTGAAIGFGFNSSVEQAQTKLSAFMGDNERVAKTLAWVKTEAAATQFSFTEMADAAANLTPVSRSTGVALEELIKQAEILAALNPAEGLTGATFSLREALSGDWVSIVDRFNLPRKRINELKEQGVPAMEIISRTLKEMGIDYSLVSKQGQTTAARFDQIKDKLNMMAGAAAKPLFDRVSKELDNLSSFDYEGLGNNLASVVAGAVQGFDAAVGFTTAFIGNVQRLPGEVSSAVQAGAGQIASWIGDRYNDVASAVSGALGLIEKTARSTCEAVSNWASENETAIKTVATVLGIIFGPALVRATVLATISGVKIAASGVAAGAGWVTGGAQATAAWVVAGARAVAASAVASVRMVAHAVAVGTAHSAQAVVASIAWTVQFARMLALSAVSSVSMAVHAADVGWAWTLNAARASFAWVTTELPKIVVASTATALASSRQAVIASAAWVAGASRSAFVWTVVELPKIVAGFVLTSGAAATHALISSGAWVGAAGRSAIAWVVVELPRIIAAFVLTSGAAIANAAVATAAWVASATTSSLAFGALRALVLTPLVMPAIAVAAALGAIALVIDAYNRMRTAVEGAKKAQQDSYNTTKQILDRNAEIQRGPYAPDVKARWQQAANKAIELDKYASGTNNARGGVALVGEHGPEYINVPQGSSVTPSYRSRGVSDRSGPAVVIENYNSYNERDDNRFFRDLGFQLELRS